MGKLKFRRLKANEIECRIAAVKEKGVSLLLYKDARVDQNILDETVGAMNWQRHHSRENANCIISIWDEEKSQWIGKEDTGKESFTDAEKGLASDSFKRACFNWGIGRELYTAPFIWVSDCNIYETGRKDKNGKPVLSCNDKFIVTQIGYDDLGSINCLTIKNGRTQKVVFKLGEIEQCEEVPKSKLEEKYVNTLFLELQRTGVGIKGLMNNYKVSDIHELTVEQFAEAMKVLKSKPDKKPDPATIPPDNCGLPFN